MSPQSLSLAATLRRPFANIESTLTAYDMVAATVVAMVGAHVLSYFGSGNLWMRVPDRILWPVFFVPLGYNVGRRLDWMLLFWAAAIVGEKQALMSPYFHAPLFPLPILVTIALARVVMEPMMRFAIQSAARFWGLVAVLAVLGPASNNVIEAGFLVVLLAMAGWLVRNCAEVPESTVKIWHYFVAMFVYQNAFTHFLYFNGPLPQLGIILAGNAYIFFLLYHFHDRLMASIRRRPKDAVEKICSFFGHKSLEIYAIHILILQAVLFAAIR